MIKKPTDFFWRIARKFLEQNHVSEGTLMGFPCLRYKGVFFATADHRTGDLIVKLPVERVQELINDGSGLPFAPAGKIFKEWVLIEGRNTREWELLISEAKEFVTYNN